MESILTKASQLLLRLHPFRRIVLIQQKPMFRWSARGSYGSKPARAAPCWWPRTARVDN